MKTSHLLVAQATAFLILGLCVGVASHYLDMAGNVVCLVVAIGIAMTVVIWTCNRFRRSFSYLGRLVEQQGDQIDTLNQDVEIQEFNTLAQLLHARVKKLNQRQDELSESSRSDVRELQEIKRFLSEIDRRDTPRNPGETAVSQLAGLMQGFGNELDSGVKQAIACAREIGRCAEQLVNGTDLQSDNVNRTTQFVDSFSAKLLAVEEGAVVACNASSKAQDCAVSGLEELQAIVAELESIRDHVGTRERKLQVLGQHSREIGSIVESIAALLSRTDLLALNASIESVRAGEHGRGFALVADEVRALSEQSAKSINDIRSRIEMIQLETQESISVASGEHGLLYQLVERLNETFNKLQHAGDASTECAATVNEISNQSQDQLKLLQDVIEELGVSADAAKGNRMHAEGIHWTAKSLQQIGRDLEAKASAIHAGKKMPAAAPVSYTAQESTRTEQKQTMVQV